MIKMSTIMAMPCTITIADDDANGKIDRAANEVLDYLNEIDENLSPFKESSEISRLNRGELSIKKISPEVKEVIKLSDQTRLLSHGYFDIVRNGQIDPCGLVKGWGIYKASMILIRSGLKNFMIEIAGDIQTFGHPKHRSAWAVGIRNPFDFNQIVKSVALRDQGIATSGTYMQGEHVYNPIDNTPATEIVSLTVIGPNVYEADRFATAAFAMGKKGISFIENYPSLEGYSIDHDGIATFTSGFPQYVNHDN